MLLEFDDSYLLGLGGWIFGLAVTCYLLLRGRRRFRTPNARRCIHALLSLWILLVMLTGFELYFAFMFDATDSFNMSLVSRKWFRKYVAPQQRGLEFQSGGGLTYRDDQEFRSPHSSEKHILFIGDSFTFGHGLKRVEDRFSNRIRTQLEQEHPGEFIVSNLADAGTDLHWVEAALQHVFEEPIRVDYVVYVMCLNDIETFHPRHRTYYSEDWSQGPQTFPFTHSYFFNLIYYRIRQFTVPQVRDYYGFVRDYYDSEPFERMQAKLAEVNRLCAKHDCQLIVVTFPFLHSIDDYTFAEAHAKITAFCEEAGIRSVDLLPALQPHADQTLTVSRFDAHPNERANRLAADYLYEQLSSLWLSGD